jgi:hypothetical protein
VFSGHRAYMLGKPVLNNFALLQLHLVGRDARHSCGYIFKFQDLGINSKALNNRQSFLVLKVELCSHLLVTRQK